MNKKARDIFTGILGFTMMFSWIFMFITGVAKIEGLIDWSWFWIFSPLWGLPAFVLVFLVLGVGVLVFISIVQLIFEKKTVGKNKWKKGDRFTHINDQKEKCVGTVSRVKGNVVYVSYENNPFDIGYPVVDLDMSLSVGRIKKL